MKAFIVARYGTDEVRAAAVPTPSEPRQSAVVLAPCGRS